MGIEVDLVFQNADHFLMVEVKTQVKAEFLDSCLGSEQKRRLSQALLFLTENLSKPIIMELAIVSHCGEVTRLEDVLV